MPRTLVRRLLLLASLHRQAEDQQGRDRKRDQAQPGGGGEPERSLLAADYMLGLLLAGGITPQDAAWACDILPLLTTASAMETAVHIARGHSWEATAERFDAAFATLPADRFPNITRHGAALISGDGDDRFRFAIDVFLDGLVARAGRA